MRKQFLPRCVIALHDLKLINSMKMINLMDIVTIFIVREDEKKKETLACSNDRRLGVLCSGEQLPKIIWQHSTVDSPERKGNS